MYLSGNLSYISVDLKRICISQSGTYAWKISADLEDNSTDLERICQLIWNK